MTATRLDIKDAIELVAKDTKILASTIEKSNLAATEKLGMTTQVRDIVNLLETLSRTNRLAIKKELGNL